MTAVVWTEQALADLASIRAFIARDASGYADVVVDRIVENVERLADFLLSRRIVPELRDERVREVILGAYRIVYRVRESAAAIITVYHSARLFDPSSIPGA